jgi:hypothetical protein
LVAKGEYPRPEKRRRKRTIKKKKKKIMLKMSISKFKKHMSLLKNIAKV